VDANALPLLAVAVSILSLAASVGIAYSQLFRAAKIRCVLPRRLYLNMGAKGVWGLEVVALVTFVNTGARDTTVTDLQMSLAGQSSALAMTMRSFFDFKTELHEDGIVRSHWQFIGHADALLIPGRSSVTRYILFASLSSDRLIAGSYQVEMFVGLDGGEEKRVPQRFRASINLSEDLTKSLPYRDARTRMVHHRVPVEVHREPRSGRAVLKQASA